MELNPVFIESNRIIIIRYQYPEKYSVKIQTILALN